MFQRVLNALRFGLVPDEYLKDITIDYKYYESCFQKIQESSNVSHFAMGPYGSGKSHFIRCVNHIAKENNFVTACIEIDSSGHISFAFPQRLYLEIFKNIKFEEDEYELSITNALENIVEIKGNEVHEIFNLSFFDEGDKKRFFELYRLILLLRKTKEFQNITQLLDAIFLGEDEFTIDYVVQELYQRYHKDGFSKNFFRVGLKPIVGHTEKSMNEFLIALLVLLKWVELCGKKGLFIFIDELIFDCEVNRRTKLQLFLQKLSEIHSKDSISLKVIFGVAKGKDQTIKVGEVLEGFVFKDNYYELKNMNSHHKLLLGENLIQLYYKAYPSFETLSKEKNQEILELLEKNSIKSDESVRGFIKNIIAQLDRSFEKDHQKDLEIFLHQEEKKSIVKASWDSKLWVDVSPRIDAIMTIVERIKWLVNHYKIFNILMLCSRDQSVFSLKKELKQAFKKGELEEGKVCVEPRTLDSLANFLLLQQFPKGTPLYDEFMKINQEEKIHYFIQTYGMDAKILNPCFSEKGPKVLLLDGWEGFLKERREILLEIVRGMDGFMLFRNPMKDVSRFIIEDKSENEEKLDLGFMPVDGVGEKQLKTSPGEVFSNVYLDKGASILYQIRCGLYQKDLSMAGAGILFYIKEMLEDFNPSLWLHILQKDGAYFMAENRLELLALSRFLQREKISHKICEESQVKILDKWISHIFSSRNFPKGSSIHLIQFKKFYTNYKTQGAIGYAEAQEIWENILEMLGKGEYVKILVEDILEAILLQSKLDERFYEMPKEKIFVSSPNNSLRERADYTVYCSMKEKKDFKDGIKESLEAVKNAYYVFTSAKEKSFFFQIPQINKEPYYISSEERWIYQEKNFVQENMVVHLEIKDGDVLEKSFLEDDIQNYIEKNLSVGDFIELQLEKNQKAFYEIFHKNADGKKMKVGTMNPKILEGFDSKPKAITNLSVKEIKSTIGYNHQEELDVWLTLRFTGLGDCIYELQEVNS